MLTEIYRKDPNNPGDWYCNPIRYFWPNAEVNSIDIDTVKKTTWGMKDPMIVGGGGLIRNENFEKLMTRITIHPDELLLLDVLDIKIKQIGDENKAAIIKWKEQIQQLTVDVMSRLDRKIGPRIMWGAGFNDKVTTDPYDIEWPDYMNRFDLIGVRDHDTGFRWVPCASCMHPLFDKQYEITNEIVWFEHKKRLLDNKIFDKLPSPRMLNTGQNLQQILEFLGSGETVITNSYHGVYWATLLGRKVVCIPWGSKFHAFKHPPVMATDKNWSDMIAKTTSYPDALAECRIANKDFHQDVVKLIDNKK